MVVRYYCLLFPFYGVGGYLYKTSFTYIKQFSFQRGELFANYHLVIYFLWKQTYKAKLITSYLQAQLSSHREDSNITLITSYLVLEQGKGSIFMHKHNHDACSSYSSSQNCQPKAAITFYVGGITRTLSI